MLPQHQDPPERLLRKPEVVARTGLSVTTIYRRELEGRFPARIHLGDRITVWRGSELAEWLADPTGYRRPSNV